MLGHLTAECHLSAFISIHKIPIRTSIIITMISLLREIDNVVTKQLYWPLVVCIYFPEELFFHCDLPHLIPPYLPSFFPAFLPSCPPFYESNQFSGFKILNYDGM